MKITQVPLDKCYTPEVRVTAVYDEEQLALLRGSLQTMGTVQPIIVFAHDDAYEVVDGLHRVEEARRRGERSIPAVVYQGDAKAALLHNLVLNKLRGKTRASEMVRVIESLWKDHGLDSVAIAQQTGLSRDYVERLQVISGAALSVRHALDQERIGVGLAYEVARLPAVAQQDALMATPGTMDRTVRDMHEFVSLVIANMQEAPVEQPQPEPRPAPAPEEGECTGCKNHIPTRHLIAVPLCPVCFGKVYALPTLSVAAAPTPQGNGGAF